MEYKKKMASLYFPIASDFRDSTVKRMASEADHSDQEAGSLWLLIGQLV